MVQKVVSKILSLLLKRETNQLNYITGAFWLFADKGIKFIAELFVGFYLARYLGVAQFGELNFAISFVILFHGFSTLGLNEILVRELLIDSLTKNRVLSTALLMRVGVSLLLIFFVQVCASSLADEARILIFIISGSLLFRSFEVFTPYFQSIVKSEWVALIQIGVTILGTACKIIGVISKAELKWFAFIYSIEWVVLAAGLFVVYIKKEQNWAWQFDRKQCLKLLKSSWYLMLSAAAVNLYMRMDQVMIRQIIDDTANGHYAAAVRLSEIWYIVPSILCAVLFPAIINAKRINPNLYRSRLLQLNSVLFWFSLIVSLLVAPIADTLIIWLYGIDYSPAGKVLQFHIWSSIFVFMGVSSGYWLIAEGFEKVSLYRTVAGLLTNMGLNFVLIPQFGSVGAAIAGLCGQIVAAFIIMLFQSSTRPIIFVQLESIIYPIRQVVAFYKK